MSNNIYFIQLFRTASLQARRAWQSPLKIASLRSQWRNGLRCARNSAMGVRHCEPTGRGNRTWRLLRCARNDAMDFAALAMARWVFVIASLKGVAIAF